MSDITRMQDYVAEALIDALVQHDMVDALRTAGFVDTLICNLQECDALDALKHYTGSEAFDDLIEEARKKYDDPDNYYEDED